MPWGLWAWQRFQQLVGALAVLIPTFFLFSFMLGFCPFSFPAASPIFGLPENNLSIRNHNAFLLGNLDTPYLDHLHIATAIGSCHLNPASPSDWPQPWKDALKISQEEQKALDIQQARLIASPKRPVAIGAPNPLRPAANEAASGQGQDNRANPPSASPSGEKALTWFERAAIYQSDRIKGERHAFVADAKEKESRLRSNQTRILVVSAAAAFLVGLQALVANKDTNLPFRSMTQGSLLPISVLVLLMPVIGTALSGRVAFDDDATTAIRDTRAVSQLEQLHGRIADDVTSDPYLCPIAKATLELAAADHAKSGFDACLTDRFERTTAWEQRHEQILNEANPTLAHAGNLPGPGESKPLTEELPPGTPQSATQSGKAAHQNGHDKCQQAFASHATPELTPVPTKASTTSGTTEQQQQRVVAVKNSGLAPAQNSNQ